MKLTSGVEQLYAAMNTSIAFIVGRNPFERLVSAYRDKILNAFQGSEHDILGRVKQRKKDMSVYLNIIKVSKYIQKQISAKHTLDLSLFYSYIIL